MAGCGCTDHSADDENEMNDGRKRQTKSLKDVKPKFDHPVYKKLAHMNSAVNNMKMTEVVQKLTECGLSTSGVNDVLKKRLKSHYRRDHMSRLSGLAGEDGKCHPYYLVIDFEATCQEENPDDWIHEIIEFPAVLINSETQQVEAEFHSYVRPVLNPELSQFCTELTGITQEDVNPCSTFPEVLDEVEKWMSEHKLRKKNTTAIITDGPWDMSRFMYAQCTLSKIPFPKWARKWINIRKIYCNFYGMSKIKLITMLENLGLSFEGHQHSGIDDSRNIARIALQLLRDGCKLKVNERISSDKLEKCKPCKPSKPAEVVVVKNQESSSSDEEQIGADMASLRIESNEDETDDGEDLLLYYASLKKQRHNQYY